MSVSKSDRVIPLTKPKSEKEKELAIGVMMGLFLAFGLYHHDTIQTLKKQSNNLENDYQIQKDKYKALENNYQFEKDSLKKLASNYQLEKDKTKDIRFNVGKSDFSCNGSCNNDYKVYFEVFQKVKLKSLQLLSDQTGNIEITVYNLNNELIHSKPFGVTTANNMLKASLDMQLETGKYYITFKGDCKLWRNTTCAAYPYEIKNVISITGTSNSNSSYYYYFYNWELAFW